MAAVLAAAAIQPEFAGLDLSGAAVGIFGRPVLLDQVLSEGDRVEIYRPLLIDAKGERRARVEYARRAMRNCEAPSRLLVGPAVFDLGCGGVLRGGFCGRGLDQRGHLVGFEENRHAARIDVAASGLS